MPEPDAGHPQPGAIAFEVLADIAEGETARVELCRVLPPHPRAGALVAVKRPHDHVAGDPTFVNQFLDEVRITSLLRHPNVVEVAGWGTDALGSFLAVELVQGVSLLRLMKTVFETGEAFTERMVVYLGSRICSGLGAAHSLRAPNGEHLNLVHRDLTPGNLLLGFNGEVKIADFDMAKAKQRLTQTLTGMRKGEPGYMAPEQASDMELDARADLFSLGVMLFELFAGRRPWGGKSEVEIIELMATRPPVDLRELRPKIDKELVNVVNHCLVRDRTMRWQSAQEIGARLDEWLAVHGYQEDNEEALARFVRRNAMRQMRWFERAVQGELTPERAARERPPRVPTYTEHSVRRPGSEPSIASAPRPPPRVAPRPGPAPTGRAITVPRPVDPRSVRAANAVQQLKKLAPPVEPRRSPAHRRTPTLDEATDVELRIPREATPPEGGGALTSLVDADEGEEVPTLVQREDDGIRALRSELRETHRDAVSAAAIVPAPAAAKPSAAPVSLVDEDDESDDRTTKNVRDDGSAPGVPLLVDPESDLPTAPRPLAPSRSALGRTSPDAARGGPSPVARVIPNAPEIPRALRPASRDGASREAAPVAAAVASVAPAAAAPHAPRDANASYDDVQVVDRAALASRSVADEDAVIAEADRLGIEAVRCAEEARAAQLRAERKAAAAKLAGEAARIAADAVRVLRTEGLASALRRIDEARGIEQVLQSGKLPAVDSLGVGVTASMASGQASSGAPPSPSFAASQPPPAPSASSGGFARESLVSVPPGAHFAAPTPPPSSGPIFAGAAADARMSPHPSRAPEMAPAQAFAAPPPPPRMVPAPPPVPVPPRAPMAGASPFDVDDFAARLQPKLFGLPRAAALGLAAAGALLVLVLVVLLAR